MQSVPIFNAQRRKVEKNQQMQLSIINFALESERRTHSNDIDPPMREQTASISTDPKKNREQRCWSFV